MQAKFVYEAMGDVLKPKSEEEIISSIESENLDPNDLLIKSSKIGFLTGVKKALEMGADVHANDDDALCWAAECGYYNIVKLLLKHGADVHAENDYALRWASTRDHYNVVKLLKKYM